MESTLSSQTLMSRFGLQLASPNSPLRRREEITRPSTKDLLLVSVTHACWRYGWAVLGETPALDLCLFPRCKAIRPVIHSVFDITRCRRAGMPSGKRHCHGFQWKGSSCRYRNCREYAAISTLSFYCRCCYLFMVPPVHAEVWDSLLSSQGLGSETQPDAISFTSLIARPGIL